MSTPTDTDDIRLWELGLEDVDLWAIKVVVREARFMALSRPERAIACQLMRRKGWDFEDITRALGVTRDEAKVLLRRDRCGVDIDALVEAFPEVMGGVIPQAGSLPISAIALRRQRARSERYRNSHRAVGGGT